MSTVEWVDSATSAFTDALAELIGEHRPHLDPAEAGRRAALDAIAGAMWSDHVGPFYDTEGVMVLLGGVTKQAVHDRVRRHRLLALRTGSGRIVYPAAQFESRQVIDGVGEVLDRIMPDGDEAWFVASWLTTPDPALDDCAPIDALRAGQRAAVLDAADDIATTLRG